jgi:hypothetical protein
MVTWSTDLDVPFIIELTYLVGVSEDEHGVVYGTYSSTAKLSKGAGLLQMGQSQVGPCSCNWRYEVASKHWL